MRFTRLARMTLYCLSMIRLSEVKGKIMVPLTTHVGELGSSRGSFTRCVDASAGRR
jgi:hypothetical protein